MVIKDKYYPLYISSEMMSDTRGDEECYHWQLNSVEKQIKILFMMLLHRILRCSKAKSFGSGNKQDITKMNPNTL